MRLIGGCATIFWTGIIYLLVLWIPVSAAQAWGTSTSLVVGVLITITYIWILTK